MTTPRSRNPASRFVAEMRPLNDWLEKYEYLIQLGDELPRIPEAERTSERAISGCQSQVWVAVELRDGRMRFLGDCDAKITRGILALVLAVVEGRTPQEVAAEDFDCIREIGLSTQLSPSRANGLASIIQRVRRLAEAHLPH